MHNLTTHYLARLTPSGGFLRADIILTVEHYGPRTRATRMGVAGRVSTSNGFVPVP